MANTLVKLIKQYQENRHKLRDVSNGMVTKIDGKADSLLDAFGGGFLVEDGGDAVTPYETLGYEAIKSLVRDKVREAIVKSSPNGSKALRDFVKYCNAGYVLTPEAHPVFDHCFDTMQDLDFGFDSFRDACFRDMFLHGGTLIQSVYVDNRLERLVALNPNSAIFKLEDRTDGKGQAFALYQKRSDGQEPLRLQDDPTVTYTPIFKSSTNPRGTNFVDAAVWHLTLSVDFFQAYKKTVDNLAWPKALVAIDRKLLKDMGYATQKIDEYVRLTVDRLKEELPKLKPGQYAIYGSDISFLPIESGMNETTLGHTPEFMKLIAKQLILAFGTNQLFAGLSDSVTETRARFETADYSHTIRPCQNALADTLTRHFNFALQNAGSSDIALLRFVRVLFADMETNAQTYRLVQEAFRAGDEAMMKLIEWLNQAKSDGYLTTEAAQEHFAGEIENRRIPELLQGLR